MNRRAFLTTVLAVPAAGLVPACGVQEQVVFGYGPGGMKDLPFMFDKELTAISLRYAKFDGYIADTVFPTVVEARRVTR